MNSGLNGIPSHLSKPQNIVAGSATITGDYPNERKFASSQAIPNIPLNVQWQPLASAYQAYASKYPLFTAFGVIPNGNDPAGGVSQGSVLCGPVGNADLSFFPNWFFGLIESGTGNVYGRRNGIGDSPSGDSIGFYINSNSNPRVGIDGSVAGGGGVIVRSNGGFAWNNGTNLGTTWVPDLLLFRDAANTLAQRNGTTAQTLRVYNTFTDASNYERGVIDWATTANRLTIGAQAAGTGTLRIVSIVGSQLLVPGDGSASAPTIANVNSTNTGFYFPGSNQVSLVLSGVSNIDWSSTTQSMGGTTREIRFGSDLSAPSTHKVYCRATGNAAQNGHVLQVAAGNGGTSGNRNGGILNLDGGAKGNSGQPGAVVIGGVNAGSVLQHTGLTIANLPTGVAGMVAYVTDGDAALAWGATAVNSGAGATKYLVWYNGTNWTVVGS